jgi:metal-responsive CopG/Arc/MetJ family transcriptional regulator
MNNQIPDQSHLAYRKSKKVLIALPPALLADLDWVASIEHSTRSELIRECLRDFIRSFKREQSTVVPLHTNNSIAAISVIEDDRYLATAQHIQG